jgi:hypothetical protein
MKYKEELKKFIGRAKYDEFGGGYIWGNSKEGNQMIAQINDFPDNTYTWVGRYSAYVSNNKRCLRISR